VASVQSLPQDDTQYTIDILYYLSSIPGVLRLPFYRFLAKSTEKSMFPDSLKAGKASETSKQGASPRSRVVEFSEALGWMAGALGVSPYFLDSVLRLRNVAALQLPPVPPSFQVGGGDEADPVRVTSSGCHILGQRCSS
jgi:hypothetical protein